MKVLAINSSARPKGQTKTGLVLDRLVDGMRDAGAEVELVELRKKKVNYCIGCFTCWTKTPGRCVHKDDMTSELFPKWLASDLVVYASPLYYFTVNAEMKAFIERTLPVLQPFFEETKDDSGGRKTRHPLRNPHPKVVMESVAGFPELSAFDQLSSWARFIYGREGNLVAEIYRPMAEMLAQPNAGKAGEILAAVSRAGREIVTNGSVSKETMSAVTQDLVADPGSLLKHAGNLMWKTCIAEGITPKEFVERGMVPRPDSIEGFMALMSFAFNPARAGEMKAVYQFVFSGKTEGACYFAIEGGRMTAREGKAGHADVTITAPFDLWMDILTKKADPQQLFLEQKYAVEGDLNLLIRMGEIYG